MSLPNGPPSGAPRRPFRWPPMDGWVSGFILGVTAGFLLGLGCAGVLAWATRR